MLFRLQTNTQHFFWIIRCFPWIFTYLSGKIWVARDSNFSGAEIKGIWKSRIKESASTCFEHAHVAKQPAPLHWQQLKSTTHHCDLRKEQNVKSKCVLLSLFALSQRVHQHVDVELVTWNWFCASCFTKSTCCGQSSTCILVATHPNECDWAWLTGD